ncbi:YdcF family protein [Alteromonas antoniana]|uniref:YdcF family protein n=1 Tax=Alteromonas antoniana TaxID=2803813 RepID=UPI001C47E928|nr:YdcF family protein [Alteromonas antoniana]
MEALKSIVLVLSSPLAISILILIVAAFFYLRHQTKRAAFLISCGTGILLVFSQPWIASLLLYPLEYPKEYPSTDEFEKSEVIYTPACYYSTKGEMPETARWADCSLQRLLHSASLSKKFNIPVVVSGGKFLRDNTVVYAQKARDFLLSVGLSSDSIIVVGEGENTFSEIQAARVHLEDKYVLAVTSATHATRVENMLIDLDIAVQSSPVDYQSSDDLDFFLASPSAVSLEKSRKAIYEYLALLKYQLESAFN